MTITIVEKEVNGNIYKNLKFSKNTMPAEFVVVEKVYDDPVSGTGEYGPWHNYLFRVKERKSVDPKTLNVEHLKDEGEAGMFASPKLHEQIVDIKPDTPFKVYKEEITGAKGTYNMFKVEMIKDEEPKEWTDEARYMMKNGLDKNVVAEQISKDHGVSKDKILDELNDLPE